MDIGVGLITCFSLKSCNKLLRKHSNNESKGLKELAFKTAPEQKWSSASPEDYRFHKKLHRIDRRVATSHQSSWENEEEKIYRAVDQPRKCFNFAGRCRRNLTFVHYGKFDIHDSKMFLEGIVVTAECIRSFLDHDAIITPSVKTATGYKEDKIVATDVKNEVAIVYDLRLSLKDKNKISLVTTNSVCVRSFTDHDILLASEENVKEGKKEKVIAEVSTGLKEVKTMGSSEILLENMHDSSLIASESKCFRSLVDHEVFMPLKEIIDKTEEEATEASNFKNKSKNIHDLEISFDNQNKSFLFLWFMDHEIVTRHLEITTEENECDANVMQNELDIHGSKFSLENPIDLSLASTQSECVRSFLDHVLMKHVEINSEENEVQAVENELTLEDLNKSSRLKIESNCTRFFLDHKDEIIESSKEMLKYEGDTNMLSNIEIELQDVEHSHFSLESSNKLISASSKLGYSRPFTDYVPFVAPRGKTAKDDDKDTVVTTTSLKKTGNECSVGCSKKLNRRMKQKEGIRSLLDNGVLTKEKTSENNERDAAIKVQADENDLHEKNQELNKSSSKVSATKDISLTDGKCVDEASFNSSINDYPQTQENLKAILSNLSDKEHIISVNYTVENLTSVINASVDLKSSSNTIKFSDPKDKINWKPNMLTPIVYFSFGAFLGIIVFKYFLMKVKNKEVAPFCCSASVATSTSTGDKSVELLVPPSIVVRRQPVHILTPSGPLGIILYSSTNGPVTQSIKSSSPLTGILFPGDVIVAVGIEERNTTICTKEWKASALTLFIARHCTRPRRIIVLR